MNKSDMIKGLQCCSQGRNGADAECGSCPYVENTLECKEVLITDALEYINESDEIRAFYVEKLDDMLAELKDRPNVVRCGECIYFNDLTDLGQGMFCAYHSVEDYEGGYEHYFYITPEAYCAWGERRDVDA